MKIQPIKAYSNMGVTKNLNQKKFKHSQVSFNGGTGAVVGATAGSTLLTMALLSTIAISGPVGWFMTAWVAGAGAVGGAALGHGAEEGIKNSFSKKDNS